MNKKVIFITLLVIAVAGAAWSQDYKLEPSTISGGGGWLEDGNYKLFDIKCTPFSGMMTDDNYYLGVDGVYGFFVEEELGPPPSLVISRQDDDIIISWPEDPDPEIYYLVGNGDGIYEDNYGAGWVLAPDAEPFDYDMDGNYMVHKDQAAGEGEMEVYYKAVPTGFDSNDLNDLTLFATAPAVGKVNVAVTEGWNQIAVPFEPSPVTNAIGTNFANGDQLWAWRDGKFIAPITFDSNTSQWGSGFGLTIAEGYGLNIVSVDAGDIKTLIGNVIYAEVNKEDIINGWNLIGNPLARSLPGNAGLDSAAGSVNGDQVWEWSEGKFLAPKTFDGENWPADFVIEIGKGYGYNHLGDGVNWQLRSEDVY